MRCVHEANPIPQTKPCFFLPNLNSIAKCWQHGARCRSDLKEWKFHLFLPFQTPGPRLNIKTVFSRYGLPLLKVRRSRISGSMELLKFQGIPRNHPYDQESLHGIPWNFDILILINFIIREVYLTVCCMISCYHTADKQLKVEIWDIAVLKQLFGVHRCAWIALFHSKWRLFICRILILWRIFGQQTTMKYVEFTHLGYAEVNMTLVEALMLCIGLITWRRWTAHMCIYRKISNIRCSNYIWEIDKFIAY